MDELMRSLLVWRGGQLVPASWAASMASQQQVTVKDTAEKSNTEATNIHKRQKMSCPETDQLVNGELASRVVSSPKCSTCRSKLSKDKLGHLPATLKVPTTSALSSSTQRVLPGYLPPPSSQVPMDGDMKNVTPTGDPDLDDDEYEPPMTMEEYDKKFPYTPRPRRPPHPTVAPLRSGHKYGDHAAAFHQACSARGLRPTFDYEEVALNCFNVVVKIDNYTLGQLGPYASKKDAKNEICKQYLPQLDNFKSRRTSTSDGEGGSYAHDFNTACQNLGIRPDFDYDEVSLGFNVTLKVNNQVLGQLGPYASKKDAKNEICKKYLLQLETLGDNNLADIGLAPPDHVNDEEWVGMVHHYLQFHKLPHPDFQLCGVHPSSGPWSCELRFSGSPPTPFGGPSSLFKRKDDAKKFAAMEAVMWLRKEGRIPQKPFFRNHKSTGPAESPLKGHIGLSPMMQRDARINARALNPGEPVGKQVTALVFNLGFTAPEFKTHQRDGSFVDMWAVFSERDTRYEPRLAGEVGRVDHIHGKKAAKEECWREVMKILEEIERGRASSA